MTVMVSTLICDRKAYSQLCGLASMMELTYQDKILYVNIESIYPIRQLRAMLDSIEHYRDMGGICHVDCWYRQSSWHKAPKFDQDTARLDPICIARNMTFQAAHALGVTHLLQVDADVAVPPDSIEKLLAVDKPFAGGVVPGRQEHKHVSYITRPTVPTSHNPSNIIEVEYSTCGFLMLQKKVFDNLRYRHGPSNFDPNTYLSEDPMLAEDGRRNGYGKWWIDTSLIARHLDNPSGESLGEAQY